MINRTENTRRFRVIDTNEVVAIYDSNRSYTLYAPICGDNTMDVSAVRTYWDDELEEL